MRLERMNYTREAAAQIKAQNAAAGKANAG
jgi:hypothetical protein